MSAAGDKQAGENDEELVYYEEEEEDVEAKTEKKSTDAKKGSYVGINATTWRDLLLKPSILQAIGQCGFLSPSQVQQDCIPQAILGQDIICQAKAGMGKTAVFVLATLQQIRPESGVVDTLVLGHTREMAFQITKEFDRFKQFMKGIEVMCIYGGVPERQQIQALQQNKPNIIVGCPGRVMSLVEQGKLKVDKLKRFVMDEVDRLLTAFDMRKQVQAIFKKTPYEKQVMMFTATLGPEALKICRKFTEDPAEVLVDDEKLTLHGLQQYYVKLSEKDKNAKLIGLLDALDFNQIVIFVGSTSRCKILNTVLQEEQFPSVAMMGRLSQEERLKVYDMFKKGEKRILVTTDICGRGVDFVKVNVVVNYDMSKDADQYLHRVGRAGRFGSKGLAITFLSSDKSEEAETLAAVQKRFEVKVKDLPDEIDKSTYMNA